MIGLFVDRILDAVTASPAKIETAPEATQIERLDFISGIATVDSVVFALTDLANLLIQLEAALDEKAATH
jgi:chemotaxis signal transduction protein